MSLAQEAGTAHVAVWKQHRLILQCSSHAAEYIDQYVESDLKAGASQHVSVLGECRAEMSAIVKLFAEDYGNVQPCALRFGDIQAGRLGGADLDQFVREAGELMGRVRAAVDASSPRMARAWGYFCAVQSDHRQLKKAAGQLKYVKEKLPLMRNLTDAADLARTAFYSTLSR